jgi:hypothetical protein
VAVGATDGCPHARKDELVQKKILPRATYEQIKCKIVEKQNEAPWRGSQFAIR